MQLQERIDKLVADIGDMNKQYVVMLEAQQLLSTVSNNNTNAVLDYITGVINKALSELFPYDTRRIYLEKSLHAGQKAHIKVKVETSDGKERDLTLQSGTGLRQIISFLFVISLIEIRKGRRILLMDELLSGLHPEAKRVVMDIVQIFAEEGFQFVMVEYGVDDVGKIYLVEKPDKVATVTSLDGNYENQIFVFNKPPEVEFDRNITEEIDEEE
jgi:predicted ATPase